jgi:hypothetical protein
VLSTDPKGAAKTAATAIASAESSGKGQAVSQALAEAVSTGGAASAQAFAQAVADNVNSGKGGAAASVSWSLDVSARLEGVGLLYSLGHMRMWSWMTSEACMRRVALHPWAHAHVAGLRLQCSSCTGW